MEEERGPDDAEAAGRDKKAETRAYVCAFDALPVPSGARGTERKEM